MENPKNDTTIPMTLRCARLAMRAAMLAMALGASATFAGHASAQSRGEAAAATEEAAAVTTPIDIQTASVEELQQLPGIGPSKAAAIVAHRERTPFRRVEDLMRVRGIGRATFRRLRDMITVSGTSHATAARSGRRAARSAAATDGD